jgi:hypothetical protein
VSASVCGKSWIANVTHVACSPCQGGQIYLEEAQP